MPELAHRPRLLCVTHCIPAPTGSGLAMRGWATLWALTETWAVTLLVVDHHTTAVRSLASDMVRRCERVVVLPKAATPEEVCTAVAGEAFAVVHVFRAAARGIVDTIAPALTGSPQRWIDLDDIESASYARMAAIADGEARAHRLRRFQNQERQALRIERDLVEQFDRVFVCSALDTGKLPPGRARIDVLPNVIFPPGKVAPARNSDPFTLLLLASWSYFPNDDGLQWLLEEIWPRARAMSPRPLRLLLAGRGRPTGPNLERIADDPDVELLGYVQDIDGLYARADLAVVPIRAGGGTRIKAIEAFAHRRPVVGSGIGLEGLDLVHGEHTLIADDPWAFAEAIVAVASDPILRERLAATGHQHWRQRFTIDAIVPVLAPGSFAPG